MNRTRPLRRRGLALLAAAAISATAACGSTVQTSGPQVLGQAGTDGLGSAGAAGGTDVNGDGIVEAGEGTVAGGVPLDSAAGGTDGAAAPVTSTGGTGGGTGGGPTGSAPTGGAAAPAPPGGLPPGPGMTKTDILLGIPYCNDCAAANAAAGAGQNDPGDTRRYYQTALDDVNARGGVLGRKLKAVFHEVSASDNLDQSAQEACSRWTDDTQVAAIYLRGEVSYQCAKKAGIMVWGGGGTKPLYDRYPNLFGPSSIVLEGLFAKTVSAMHKAGWHKPDTKWPTGKIGLITWQSPEYEYAMKNGYLKEMARLGLKDEDVRYISVPQNANALADASAAISSAVLAFQQKGIDHVFIGDGPAGIFAGTGLTLLFLQNAKSQGYYPRYGFNTNNSPDFPSHPQDQLVGMLAIDGNDSEPANDEGIAPNPQRERCLALMKKKGLNVGDSLTRLLAVSACEIAWFTEAVFKRAGTTSLDRVIAGGESLGTSYRSPITYGTRLTPGRRDGLYLFRNLRYDEGCSCVKYTSKPYEP